MAIVALLIGLIGLWLWQARAERRAVLRMKPDDRMKAYQAALASFRHLCESPAEPLIARCEDQARFLRGFPECDARCEELTGRFLSRVSPTR